MTACAELKQNPSHSEGAGVLSRKTECSSYDSVWQRPAAELSKSSAWRALEACFVNLGLAGGV